MSNNTAGVQAFLGGYKSWEKLPAPFTIVATGSYRPNAGPYARDFQVSDGNDTFWIVLSAEPPPPVTVIVPSYTYWEKFYSVVTTAQVYSSYDGTAESIGTLTCAGYYSFKVPRFVIGAAVGLSKFPTQIGYDCIEHGLHFANGKVRVVENGTFVTAETSYDDQTYFSISRDEDGEVTYYSGSVTTELGTLFYTSAEPNLGITRLHAALFQGNDKVVGMDGPHQGTCPYVDEPATGGIALRSTMFGMDIADYNIGTINQWSSCGGQEATLYIPDMGAVYTLTAASGFDLIDSVVCTIQTHTFCWGYDFGVSYNVGIIQQFSAVSGFEGEVLTSYGAIALPDLRMLFDEGYVTCLTDCGGTEYSLPIPDGVCTMLCYTACSGSEYALELPDGSVLLTVSFRIFGSDWPDHGGDWIDGGNSQYVAMSCVTACIGYDSWRQLALAPSLVFVMNGNTLGVVEYSVPAVSVSTMEGDLYFTTSTSLLQEAASGFSSGLIKTGHLLIGGQEYNIPMITLEGEGVSGAVVAYSKERGLGVRSNEVSVPFTAIADRHEIMLGTQPQATSYQFEIQLGGPGRVNHFGAYVNPIRRRRA